MRTAQLEAAKHFVDIMELQQAVGKRLAELTGAESGMVTSGAAAAMASATAACLAGNEPTKIWQLPDTTGLKHAVVMVGGRSAFDSAIRLAGAQSYRRLSSTLPLTVDSLIRGPPGLPTCACRCFGSSRPETVIS